ncbi:MAG: WD40 repeat domain-containing serine/threonine-protein kinase, partial [Cyanobacteria bacterium J06633_8]
GTSIGTPEFVAPEQSRGKALYSSDLYSLGTTCIYLLTGVSPFELFDISEYTWVWRQYLIDNTVSDKLGYVLDKLIENATSRRYQSATEILKVINPLQTTYTNKSQLPNQNLPIKLTNKNQNNKVVAVQNKQYVNIAKIPSPSNDKKLNYTWKCIDTLNHHAASISSIAISPDGKILASGSSYCAIKLWNINTNKSIQTLCSDNAINTVAFSPNGLYIASGDSANNIIIWDRSSSIKIKAHTGLFAGVSSVTFSPDGQILVSAGSDKTVKLWDVNSEKIIKTLQGHDSRVCSVAISPDGKLIASGSTDRRAIVWDLNTGKLLHTFYHTDVLAAVRCVAFSSDGRFLSTGSEDCTIKLWKITSGEEVCTLQRNSSGIRYVTFSPNGKILASSSDGNDIKLWNVNTKQEIYTLKGHSAKVNSIVFSPDGKTLYSGSDDKTIKIWRCQQIN